MVLKTNNTKVVTPLLSGYYLGEPKIRRDILRVRNEALKTQIYYSRTYRHLKPNKKERLFFLLGCVVPCVVIFLFFYTEISYLLADWVKDSLLVTIPEHSLGIEYGEFLPFFGGVYFVQVPNILPSFHEVTLNLGITLFLLSICFFTSGKSKGGTPITVYFAIILLTHLVACIFFMFAMNFYPYTATQYSELYIKQQVGIWLSFLILTGLITGILGYGRITIRLLSFWGTMVYSFIFGCVRYLASLYIITTGSSLYMATLFFSLGPLFDFLFLVCFYGIYISTQIKRLDQREGRLEWHWL